MEAAIKERAWFKTSVEFKEYLDINEIYASLVARGYLTGPQKKQLLSNYVDSYTKIKNLMEWMPSKGGDWFAGFVGALNDTKSGTGHLSIINDLRDNLYEAAKESNISHETIEGEVTGKSVYACLLANAGMWMHGHGVY